MSFDPKLSLSHYIKLAIANRNVSEMYELKTICDKLHAGLPEYKGFTALPTDQLYEEMNSLIPKSDLNYHDISVELSNAIKSNANEIKVLTSKGNVNSDSPKFKNHQSSKLRDLWMDSIPKLAIIKQIPDAIVMPKFDGCSCGVKYARTIEGLFEPIKAATRGTESAHKQESSDILNKYLTIAGPLTDAINQNLNSVKPFVFANGLTLQHIQSISFRGEIVACNASEIDTAPAAYSAGKINGGMEVWNKAVDTLCYIPFEIMNIVLTDETKNKVKESIKGSDNQTQKKSKPMSSEISAVKQQALNAKIDPRQIIDGYLYSPTQSETLDFLDAIGMLQFEPFIEVNLVNDEQPPEIVKPKGRGKKKSADPTEFDDQNLKLIRDYFFHYQDTCPQPLDGVVYCSAQWRYPQFKSESTAANYDKFAWKPTSESTSKLTGVNYNIARDGKIGFELLYEPVMIGPKEYKRCKSVPTQLENLKGIGIGSVVSIKLCGDINPYIMSFEPDDTITPYSMPTECPFCKTKLVYAHKKDSLTIRCPNKGCNEQMIQKFMNLLKYLNISGLAEGKLRKLKPKELTIEGVINKYFKMAPNMFCDQFAQIGLRAFLFAMGCGTEKQIQKATPDFEDDDLMIQYLDVVDEFLGEESNTDPFVEDVLTYIHKCFDE